MLSRKLITVAFMSGREACLPFSCLQRLFVLFYNPSVLVELVVFCNTSSLQKRLYQAAIRSRMVRSCLSSYYRGSQHLICISALKKLCNHPVLLLNATRKNTNPASHHKSGEDEDDILLEDEVTTPVSILSCYLYNL